MELNRRTKLVGGVLALAVAALIYDRAISSGGAAPAQAGAAETPEAPAAAPVHASKPAKPDESVQRGLLSAKLASLDMEDDGPGAREDAFMAPVGWFPVDEAPTRVEKAQPRISGGHTVSAVMMDRDKKDVRFVVVDGKTLRPGSPVKCTVDEKPRVYELVRAWVDDDKKTHVEVLINDELYELLSDEPRLKDQ